MSVDQVQPRPSASRTNDAKLVRYDDFIDAKIESTRRAVKLVDLATALVALVAGVLAYLLVAAVVEHWLVRGGFSVAARMALFAVLLIGIGYFTVRRLWPLLARAINPVYAARTIEQGSPSLKNSLINLLFFRERRSEISDAVYRTLEEQAAQRLTRAPVETAVDRSSLIRLGYVLVAVVALVGLYKIFSPKDPVTAAGRILMPWADIVPASRVVITAVKPGSHTVARGEFVEVSAEVRGLDENETVVLRYATADGQIVAKPIPMKPAGDGKRYTCRLADEADGNQQVGLTRNISYRLEAGDARSLDYAITVVEAPSILVERVDYDYPAYTSYIDRTVRDLGDVRAIEGTRVTVHARANGSIRDANVDFEADGRSDLRMTSTGEEARATFELSLRQDRQTPRYGSYVLRFTNEDNRANLAPVKHSIHVERDDNPEAAILMPKEKSIDVRLDETVLIEVEARDPDFRLSAVRLKGEVVGRTVMDELLLKANHQGRFTARYSFVPKARGLRVGEEVKYWVEASDNRTPKPNTTATEDKRIRILSPNPAQQPPPDRVARNDRQQPQEGAGEKGEQQEQKDGGGAAGQNGNADKQDGGEAGGQQAAGEKQGQGDKNKEQQGEGGKGAADSKSDAKSGDDGSQKNGEGSEQKNNENQPGGKGQADPLAKSNQEKSDGQKSNGEQTGAGAAGSQSSKDTAQPDGTRPDNATGLQTPDGKQQKGDKQSKPGNQQTPVSSDGDNDGEAFDRIQRHMDRNGETKDDTQSSRDAGTDQQVGGSAEERGGEGEKGRRGEDKQSQTDAAKDQSQSDAKSESKKGEPASADDKRGADPAAKPDSKPGDPDQKQTPGEQMKDRGEGPGAKTRGDDMPQTKQSPSDRNEQDKSPGGQQTASKGDGGAGDEKNSQGSPNSQPDMKPTDKHEQSPSKDTSNEQEPPAGARGKKESDSQGDQGGDRAGGGEEGGGQKAPREGTGSAGQNQSADEGAGESAEQGKGNTSPDAGRDAKADKQTGSSGNEKGSGSKLQDGKGEKPGGKSADEPSAKQGDTKQGDTKQGDTKQGDTKQGDTKQGDTKQGDTKQPDKSSRDAQQDDNETGRNGDKETGKQDKDDAASGKKGDQPGSSGAESGDGEGQPGTATNPQPSITGEAPEGDAANLEYARKKTDLVLEKLSDQMSRNKVDDRLLKDLGWSRDDLRRFVERWQQRKEAAQRDDPAGDAAKRELDDALRSLGLRRVPMKQNAVKKDSMRDLREGYRGPVPLEYQERLRIYNQGVSRARPEGE